MNSQSTATTPDKYVRFQINILEDVALKYATGIPAPATRPGYSDQIRFALCDGRIMYVAPFAAEMITLEGIKPGEPFQIGKVECRNNQRRSIEWRVQRVPPTPPTPVPPAPPRPTPPPQHIPENALERDLRMSAENIAAQKAGRPLPHAKPAAQTMAPRPVPPAALPAAPATASNGSRNISTRAQPVSQPIQPIPQPGPLLKIPFDQAMTKFLIIAGRATRDAETVLGSEGGSVRFDSRDVAALATTIMIHAAREGHLLPCPDWPRANGANHDPAGQ
jgi:hypothetical protein